jgi:hypothetical protein
MGDATNRTAYLSDLHLAALSPVGDEVVRLSKVSKARYKLPTLSFPSYLTGPATPAPFYRKQKRE